MESATFEKPAWRHDKIEPPPPRRKNNAPSPKSFRLAGSLLVRLPRWSRQGLRTTS